MKKQLFTLLCVALVSLPSASGLFAKATTTSFVAPAAALLPRPAVWMPNDILRTLAPIQLSIVFSQEGQDNYWDIVFVDANYTRYEFLTDDNTAATGVLGEVPAGVYTIYFTQTHGRHSYFDYFAGCNQAGVTRGYQYGNVYGTTIDEQCNSVIIDSGY